MSSSQIAPEPRRPSGGAKTFEALLRERRRLPDRTWNHSDDVITVLLAGDEPPPGTHGPLAESYCVFVARHSPDVPAAQVAEVPRQCGGSGTFVSVTETGIVALIPRHAQQRTVENFQQWLGGSLIAGVATRKRTDIPSGYREAVQILDLAHATRRSPGVYRLANFLVEYAVTRHEFVSGSLASIVARLMTVQPVLYETLKALVHVDFNRNDTAHDLFVHRSTLDYRIARIAQLTGQDPMSRRGAQVLRAALAAHTLARRSS
ncbi:PucR family transcriptional regulator [Saccharothrix deserti]|uniref:PucR family transcriptional regulator n=1 Tax=Saccharothrix deserti TaxID=2593674 RepID=UPI00131E6AC2|nr:helix-turn-helix domain-containing protein [Saccharothrix deserti]